MTHSSEPVGLTASGMIMTLSGYYIDHALTTTSDSRPEFHCMIRESADAGIKVAELETLLDMM